MTNDEALKSVNHRLLIMKLNKHEFKHPPAMLIETIDFLETAKSAIEKQIPRKPKHVNKNDEFDGNWVKVCPVCGMKFVERFTNATESYPRIYHKSKFCNCGQAIDWSDD